jgi:hypothetical protein
MEGLFSVMKEEDSRREGEAIRRRCIIAAGEAAFEPIFIIIMVWGAFY